jgi:hypothetical protein
MCSRFCMIIAVLVLAGVFSSCERYEQKSQAKERRRDYMQGMIDSARKADNHKKDSLRLVQDTAKKK